MGFTAFSQDVIITNSNEQIRVKIVEVTDDAVSYKKYHDQEGGTFVLKKDKIKIILWENGDVDEYKEVVSEQKVPAVQESENLPFITRKFGGFYLDNGKTYDRNQFKQFLIDKNLSPIWMKYSSGQNLLITGWVLMGSGVGICLIAGTIVNSGGILDALFIGLPLYFIGGLVGIAGIPLAIAGTVKKNVAISDYNNNYAGKPRTQYGQNVTFKAGFTGSGLGFSLNF
jgi:hypothetical protein